MLNTWIKKLALVLCLVLATVILGRIYLPDGLGHQVQMEHHLQVATNKQESQIKKNAAKKVQTGNKNETKCELFTNSYNYNSMCDENKQKYFQNVLTKSNDQFDKEITEIDLLLLGQLNREISESSYGQENREIREKQQNDVVVVGSINTSRPYAVFSTTISNREALSFVFLLPLTVLSWKRVGFESVILVVGWRDEWNTDPLYSDIFLICRKLGAVLIFLQPKPENNIMISQVSRLFAANILQKEFHNQPGINDVYFLTTDADIWPLSENMYQLPENYDILSLNSFCCSPFTHRNKQYRMLPMTNIGATVATWGKLTESNGTTPSTIGEILAMFQFEFGPVAREEVLKGENLGWYLDQRMISLLIDKYLNSNKNLAEKVKFVARSTNNDRIDRSNWSLQNGIKGKVDSHLLLETFTPGVWVRVVELLKLMYGDISPEYEFCVNYYEQFHKLFSTKKNNDKKTN